MPRPRFARLDDEKRARILEAAAQEFAANGYENASLNRILETAGISKGAAYYYFDDKADLFSTVMARAWDEMGGEVFFDLETLTAESFWPALADTYRRQFAAYRAKPWLAGLMRALATLPQGMVMGGALGDRMAAMIAWLETIFERGKQLGVIRGDLPADLLLALVMTIDQTADRWMMTHWDELDQTAQEHQVDLVVDLLRRVLAPAHTISY
jgi:AcrR family transcriptional regulator